MIPVVGVAGCLILALSLPWISVVTGAGVVVLGIVIFMMRRLIARQAARPAKG